MTLGIIECARPQSELQNWIPVLAAGFAGILGGSLYKDLLGNVTYALNRVDGR